MVNIKLDDKVSIVSDSNQYILREFKGIGTDKEGNEKENHEPVGYFPTVAGALKYYVDSELRQSKCKSIGEMLVLHAELEKKIDNLIKF